jgi:hypothetical protein
MEATGGSSYPQGMGRRLLVVAVAVVLVGLAGCGDDEGRVTAEGDTGGETTSTTEAEGGQPTPTVYASDLSTTTTAHDPGTTTTTGRPGLTTSTTMTTSTSTTTSTTSPSTTTSPTTAPPQPATYPKDAGTPDRRVRLTLTLDRTEVPAKGVLTVENTSTEEVRAERGGCDFVWGLYRDGTFVGGHEPMACPAYLRNDRLKPGEIRRYEMTFDGLDDREPRKPLPPGTYDAFAGWDVAGGHWYAPPVTVTVR